MILIDTSEPGSILQLLQQAIPITQSPLNQRNIADYFFGNYEGRTVQFNRVQAGELAGNVDSMEDELKRYYDSADETSMIIEGLISPVKLYMKEGSAKVTDHSRIVSTRDLGAKVFTYQVEPSGFIEHGHSFTTTRMSELYAWIYRLSKFGIITYFTNNWEETARFLITVYKNEQKSPEEHSTFQRIYRPHIYIKTEKNMTKEELDTHKLTKSLMFLSNAYKLEIGEVKAKALAEKFCNIMDIALASPADIASVEKIGYTTAKKILSALGRNI